MENKFFNDYVLEYLEKKETHLSIMTYHHYSLLIHKHILPYFEDVRVNELNKEKMIQFLNSIMMEESSKNVIKSIMKSIIEYMYHDDVPNIIELIPLFVQNTINKDMIVLSREEVRIVKEYCLNHLNEYTLSILLVLECGIKISELCALTKEDLYEQKLHVHRQLQRIPNRDKDLKKTQMELFELDDISNRYIPVPDWLYQLLVVHNQNENTFLLSRKKEYKGARIYQVNVKRIVQELGIEFNYNVLRETFKHNCIQQNMNIYDLMEVLGVSNMTFNINDRWI